MSRLLEIASDDYVKKSMLARPIGVDFIRQLKFSFDSNDSGDEIVAAKSSVYYDKVQQLWRHYNLDAYPRDINYINHDGNREVDMHAKEFEVMLNDLEYVARTSRSRVSFKKSFENYLRTGISYTSFIEISKTLLF